MSSFRDHLIERINTHYYENINNAIMICKCIVKIINLYIEHQDKIHEKIFNEDAFCDLVYDKEFSEFIPQIVVKSRKDDSYILPIDQIPSFSESRKVSKPDSFEIPAPVNMTTFFAFFRI